MKTANSEMELAVELLYGSGQETESKVSQSEHLINRVYPRPSLIPGIKYPISDREEHLLDLAWNHFCNVERRGFHE